MATEGGIGSAADGHAVPGIKKGAPPGDPLRPSTESYQLSQPSTAGGAAAAASPSAATAAAPESAFTASPESASSSSSKSSWRHAALLWLACFLTLGAYYAKDVLAAVSPELMAQFGMSRQAYGALYGLPAIPNIFASLIGGALVDGIGSDVSALLLGLVIVLGSVLTSFSAPYSLPGLLAAGQLVMGIGKGSLITAQKVFLKKTAKPDEVSLFFAFSFSTSHAGTFLAFLLSPLVSRGSSIGYQAALWTSTAICVLSALCAFPLVGKVPRPSHGGHAVQDDEGKAEEEEEEEEEAEQEGKAEWSRRLWRYWQGLANPGFVCVLVSVVCFYSAFFPFLAFSVHFLVSQGIEKRSASLYASLLPLGSIFLGPYFGHRVDVELGKPDRPRHGWWPRGGNAQTAATGGGGAAAAETEAGQGRGRLARWLAVPGSVQLWSMLVTVAGLVVIIAEPLAWIVGFIAMGMGFAMASAALWPMVPVFVQGPSLGLGFGLVHAIMDLVLLLVTILVGRLLDAGRSYPGTVLPLLLGIVLVGLVASVLQIRLLLALRQEEGEKDAPLAREGPSAEYPALLPAQQHTTRAAGDVESG